MGRVFRTSFTRASHPQNGSCRRLFANGRPDARTISNGSQRPGGAFSQERGRSCRISVAICARSPPAATGDRGAEKRRHVGYYLIDRGLPSVRQRIRYRPSFDTRLQQFVRNNPDEFYIIGIEFVTLITVAGIILPYSHGRYPLTMFVHLRAVATHTGDAGGRGNSEVPDYVHSAARGASKMDFSDGVPADCGLWLRFPRS